MHWGRTVGQGAEGAGDGLETSAGEFPLVDRETAGAGEFPLVDAGATGAGVLPWGAVHWVQIVEVIVLVAVDTVVVVWTVVLPPVVSVFVTGHVVKYVVSISVVTIAWVLPVTAGTVVSDWGELALPELPGVGTGEWTTGPDAATEGGEVGEAGGGTHCVQTVEMLVLVIVEMVVVVWVVVMLPVVIVFVTGQVVCVVTAISVVYTETVVPGTGETGEDAVGEDEILVTPVGESPVAGWPAGVGVPAGEDGLFTEYVAGVVGVLAGINGVLAGADGALAGIDGVLPDGYVELMGIDGELCEMELAGTEGVTTGIDGDKTGAVPTGDEGVMPGGVWYGWVPGAVPLGTDTGDVGTDAGVVGVVWLFGIVKE